MPNKTHKTTNPRALLFTVKIILKTTNGWPSHIAPSNGAHRVALTYEWPRLPHAESVWGSQTNRLWALGISLRGEKGGWDMKLSIYIHLTLSLLFHGVITPFCVSYIKQRLMKLIGELLSTELNVMLFGTKTVKIRRSVQHSCLSVHNMTFIFGELQLNLCTFRFCKVSCFVVSFVVCWDFVVCSGWFLWRFGGSAFLRNVGIFIYCTAQKYI